MEAAKRNTMEIHIKLSSEYVHTIQSKNAVLLFYIRCKGSHLSSLPVKTAKSMQKWGSNRVELQNIRAQIWVMDDLVDIVTIKSS